MSETGEESLLALCPRCTYELRGLPMLHRCPECGLQVDRRWQVFGGRSMPESSKRVVRPMIGFLFVWLGIASLGALLPLFLGGIRRAESWIAPVAVYSAVGFAYWAMLRKPKGFVAVGSDGLVIYRGRNRFEYYSPQQVETIRHDLGFKRLRLVLRDQPPKFIDHFTFFGPHVFEADRCIRGIKEALAGSSKPPESNFPMKEGGIAPTFGKESRQS